MYTCECPAVGAIQVSPSFWCHIVPRHWLIGARRFRTARWSHLQGSNVIILYRNVDHPWPSDAYNTIQECCNNSQCHNVTHWRTETETRDLNKRRAKESIPNKGAQIPRAKLPRRLNTLRWLLIFVDPQYGGTFIAPCWRPKLWSGSQIFGICVQPWF